MNKVIICQECGYIEMEDMDALTCVKCKEGEMMELIIETIVESEELDKLNNSIGILAYVITFLGVLSALATAIMFITGVSHTTIVYTSLILSAINLALTTVMFADIIRGVKLRQEGGA